MAILLNGEAVMAMTPKGMVLVPGGPFVMGSADFYPGERPPRRSVVGDLWVDEHPVTNAQFQGFVDDTGHVTFAERAPDPEDFPGADPADLVPGSQVFVGAPGPFPLDDWTRWWSWAPGADWRHPRGPTSSLRGRELHPVVHVGYEDALAYAEWAGTSLLTEAEWEHAARGGLSGATYPWGDDLMPGGRIVANTWHGQFPYQNLSAPGMDRTTPGAPIPTQRVRPVRRGGQRLGMDPITVDGRPLPGEPAAATHSCCAPTATTLTETDRRVMKGGSHLCAPSYCRRYRPAARQGQAIRSTTGHLGVRCGRPA